MSSQPMPYIPPQQSTVEQELMLARALFEAARLLPECHAGEAADPTPRPASCMLGAAQTRMGKRWILDLGDGPGTAMPSGLFKRDSAARSSPADTTDFGG
jgi:hypothetical protein